MPLSKVWGSESWARRPLPTGIVRRQLPSLRSTTWRNNGSSTRNGSCFEHHIHILNGEYIHGVKLKMSCYNRDQDRSVGVCCHNALGLVRRVRQIPRPIGLRIWLPVSHAPSSIVTTTPSTTGLNPLVYYLIGLKFIYIYIYIGMAFSVRGHRWPPNPPVAPQSTGGPLKNRWPLRILAHSVGRILRHLYFTNISNRLPLTTV